MIPPTTDEEATYRRARNFARRWDRLTAQGLTDHEVRDMLAAAAPHPTPERPAPMAAPPVPYPKNSAQAAGQAMRDVDELTCDVRDVDPRDLWDRIASWTPERIVTALITACAARNPDSTIEDDLAWVRTLAPVQAAS